MQKIYEATAIEQDRKAEAYERQEAETEKAKVEREREQKTREEWKKFKGRTGSLGIFLYANWR